MFGEKFLKTTALALSGAFIIFILSGTAQASVAAENLIAQDIETVDTASFYDGRYKRIPRETLKQRKERLEHERKRERRDYHRWHKRYDHRRPHYPPPHYPPPPPPPPRR